jgi:hypothetical protein
MTSTGPNEWIFTLAEACGKHVAAPPDTTILNEARSVVLAATAVPPTVAVVTETSAATLSSTRLLVHQCMLGSSLTNQPSPRLAAKDC